MIDSRWPKSPLPPEPFAPHRDLFDSLRSLSLTERVVWWALIALICIGACWIAPITTAKRICHAGFISYPCSAPPPFIMMGQ